MYKHLKIFHPAYDSPLISKEALYKKITPDREYNDNTIRSLLSRLEQCANTFLIVERTLDKEKERILLDVFSERKLKGLFEDQYDKCKEKLHMCRGTDSLDFYLDYYLDIEKFNFIALNGKVIKKAESDQSFELLSNIMNNLFNFFITSLIQVSLSAIVYSEMLNVNRNISYVEDLVRIVNLPQLIKVVQKDNKSDYVLDLYYALYKMMISEKTSEQYFLYKEMITSNIYRLNNDEISFHYSKLITYCIDKATYNDQSEEFRVELFNVFKTYIENKYYRSSNVNYLRPVLFRSALLSGLKAREYEWCNHLLKNSHNHLQVSDRSNLKNLGYAFYYFEMNEFRKTLEFASKIDIESFTYLYDVKNLTVRSYYELGYFDEAFSYINSYKSFLNKNLLVSDLRRTRFTSFLDYVEKLILLSGKPDSEIDYLICQLSKTANISYKDWLLEKARSLQKTTSEVI